MQIHDSDLAFALIEAWERILYYVYLCKSKAQGKLSCTICDECETSYTVLFGLKGSEMNHCTSVRFIIEY